MPPQFPLVPETILSEQSQFFVQLLLPPGVARSFELLFRLSRVSQELRLPFSRRSCSYFFSSVFLLATFAASNRSFFFTPTAFPLRPVVLLLCPRTFKSSECRIPFLLRMSF